MTNAAKNRWRGPLLWLIGGAALAYVLAFLAVSTTGDSELYECKNLASAILAKHSIPESKSALGHPAIYCHSEVRLPFLTRYNKAFIYGVTDKASQDAIVGTTQQFHRDYHSRKILVQFFEAENWTTWSDRPTGNRGGARGPETPMRIVWIK